jgi:hypothetical protein
LDDYYPDFEDEEYDPLAEYEDQDPSVYDDVDLDSIELAPMSEIAIDEVDMEFDTSYVTQEIENVERPELATSTSPVDEPAFTALAAEISDEGAIEIDIGEVDAVEQPEQSSMPEINMDQTAEVSDQSNEPTFADAQAETDRLLDEVARESISREYPPLVTRYGGLRPA